MHWPWSYFVELIAVEFVLLNPVISLFGLRGAVQGASRSGSPNGPDPGEQQEEAHLRGLSAAAQPARAGGGFHWPALLYLGVAIPAGRRRSGRPRRGLGKLAPRRRAAGPGPVGAGHAAPADPRHDQRRRPQPGGAGLAGIRRARGGRAPRQQRRLDRHDPLRHRLSVGLRTSRRAGGRADGPRPLPCRPTRPGGSTRVVRDRV